jgi:methyl-accepting chemotaxis protein
MAIKHGKRKIQNYLIAKDIQFRIIFSTLIFFFSVVILVVSLVLSPRIFTMLISDSMDIQHQAAQTFLVVIKWLIPTVLVISLLIFIHHVIVTHRIYGPMFNFSKVFKKISQGDLSQKVFIRRKDYLHNECNNINEMIAGLAAIISRIQTGHDNLISALENHAARIRETESPETFRTSLDAILDEARSVRDQLTVFKLAPSKRETEAELNPKDCAN